MCLSANDVRLKGCPVQVLVPSDNHTFELNIKELEKILLDENIRNKNVAVISIVGAFRKGKSFILDFFLRYLNAQVGIYNFMSADLYQIIIIEILFNILMTQT